jgi:putative transcriptional regulator
MGRLSNRVKHLRAERSMTQQALADAIGLTRQTVIAIEGDKYSPSLETAFRIAEVFGVELGEVFLWG